jgi:hypothetical protein
MENELEVHITFYPENNSRNVLGKNFLVKSFAEAEEKLKKEFPKADVVCFHNKAHRINKNFV